MGKVKLMMLFSLFIATISISILPAQREADYLIKNSSTMSQEELSSDVVRFHIIANSNNSKDQEIKLLLRDAFINEYKDSFLSFNDKEKAEDYIKKNINNIEKETNVLLHKIDPGEEYTAKAVYTRCRFPKRVYGDVTFPEGDYDALRIIIGKGEGKNWWCVLYPPLCLMNVKEDCSKRSSETTSENNIEVRWRFFEFIKGFFE